MHVTRAAWLTVLALAGTTSTSRAEPASAPPPEPAVEPVAPPPTAPTVEELAEQIEELRQSLELEQARHEGTRTQVKALMPLRTFIRAYVDLGAFAVAGDGSGIRSDLGHLYYPQHGTPAKWVFVGDPLSTAINALGEPADTSDSREVVDNPLASKGHPSLLVSSIGLRIGMTVGHDVSFASLVELLPRPNSDQLDIEYAHVDWRPWHEDDADLVISAGKIDSVLGLEYRTQDAPDRLTVTPSLINRYLSGRPLGVQARLVLGPLSASAALTNGDSFVNRFEPSTVLHASALPTASGHVQLLFTPQLELGISAAAGPQDKQADTDLTQWHLGFDARLTDVAGFDATAEYVQGNLQGMTSTQGQASMVRCDLAPCLDYKGAYLLVERHPEPWLRPYARLDWRDAVHESGARFVYESHVVRVTLGARFELTHRIVAKVEYTFNRELGPMPDFPDDILTSSVVVATD